LDHNPFVYFYDVTGNPPSTNSAYGIAHLRPYETEFARDLTNNHVASYNFVVPNDYDQGEKLAPPLNNLVRQADTWLAREIPKVMASSAYTNGGVILILWDEGVSSANNPSGLIVVSPLAKVGYSNSIAYTHASTVRTVQEIFGLTPLLRQAATAVSLSDLFKVYP
jgi:phospholipase C